jgi:hypothetical protein
LTGTHHWEQAQEYSDAFILKLSDIIVLRVLQATEDNRPDGQGRTFIPPYTTG